MSEHLTESGISDVMERAYIDYSMSVIVSRALPDVRDGCKPVHRRVLYAMLREGLLHNRAFDKCAGVVGEVLKNYHPHGDTSVYDTLVRMAQPWVMRYPLVIPQGNFGSVDGDPPAAYRYTECKLSAIAEDLLRDLDEDTVDFVPNYKESTTEPSVLPSAVPNLLMNGSTGIAVGMATNIPPHNLGELIDGLCLLIDKPESTLDDIIEIIPGPDFPTGGLIMGRAGCESYLRTGRGIVKTRGIVEFETTPAGRDVIIIKELPYNTNRATLVTHIADLIQGKAIEGISDLRDESDERTRIVIELKRGEIPRVIVNQLYKQTQLGSSFGVILLSLDKRRPKEMNIKEMLQLYLEHRRDVITRRTQFRLRKAEDRAHILEGYLIALDNLDDFVKIIRASASRLEAKDRLMAKYPITERQTDAILDLRLYQLTGLERDKIEKEYAELKIVIADLRDILANEKRLLSVIREELVEMRDKYADERRSRIVPDESELRMEDLVKNEGVVITVTENGQIKRTPVNAYKSQKRGGKGVIGAGSHDDDAVRLLFTAQNHDNIMAFTQDGRVYVEKVYEIPEGLRTSKGRSVANLFAFQENESIAAFLTVPNFDTGQSLVLCTRKGVIKKSALTDYRNHRAAGLNAINVDEGDEVIRAVLTSGKDDLMIITRDAASVRFNEESELRELGRNSRGVRGIALREGDVVVSLEVVDPEGTLLIAAADGYGKRTHFAEWLAKGRATMGVTAMKTESPIIAAITVKEDDQIMILTKQGQAVRTPVSTIRIIGRSTQGVRLVNLDKKDELLAVSKVVIGEIAEETPAEAVVAEGDAVPTESAGEAGPDAGVSGDITDSSDEGDSEES